MAENAFSVVVLYLVCTLFSFCFLYFAQDEIPPFARCRILLSFAEMVSFPLDLIRSDRGLVDLHGVHSRFNGRLIVTLLRNMLSTLR